MATAARQQRRPPTELHEAALYGCPHAMIDLLDGPARIDIDRGTPTGSTPIMLAAQEGRSEIVRILLDYGANISIKAQRGFTVLHIAAQQGHLPVVVELVNARAEVDARNDNDDRALHLAAMNGHVEVVTTLIKAGAHLEAASRPGFTPLHISASDGQWEAVQALLAAGAKVDSRLPDGATPLYLASERGHTNAVRELRRAKANALLASVNPWGESQVPLDTAALGGHAGVVRELLEKLGGGIKSCGGASGGVDALRNAAEKGCVDILAMLTQAGVVDTGTALLRAAGLGETSSVKFLLRQRSKGKTSSKTDRASYVNTRHASGRTPLFCNIMLPYCSPRMVRLLVDAGADVTSAFSVSRAGHVFFDDTALALATFQLRKKMVNGQPATKEQLDKLGAIRRLLLTVEAAHAVSWLWPTSENDDLRNTRAEEECHDSATAPSAQLTAMLPIMRRRVGRRGVLLSALFRNARKP